MTRHRRDTPTNLWVKKTISDEIRVWYIAVIIVIVIADSLSTDKKSSVGLDSAIHNIEASLRRRNHFGIVGENIWPVLF